MRSATERASRGNRERRGSRRAHLLLFTCAVACLAAVLGTAAAWGQGGETGSPAADQKTIVKIGWMGDIDNLNPLIGWSNNIYEIYSNGYLLLFGRDWETLGPDDSGIVKSWEVSEDGLDWTLTLNEGMV